MNIIFIQTGIQDGLRSFCFTVGNGNTKHERSYGYIDSCQETERLQEIVNVCKAVYFNIDFNVCIVYLYIRKKFGVRECKFMEEIND